MKISNKLLQIFLTRILIIVYSVQQDPNGSNFNNYKISLLLGFYIIFIYLYTFINSQCPYHSVDLDNFNFFTLIFSYSILRAIPNKLDVE